MLKKIAEKKRCKKSLVRQYDSIDCGPAAILSVLRYFGGDADLVKVRSLCRTGVNGSTMLGVVNAACALGLKASGAVGEYADLQEEQLPCVAHVIMGNQLSHFIVIYYIDDKVVYVGDPGKGCYYLTKSEFLDIWQSKSVILFKPGKELHCLKSETWIKWVTSYLKKHETWIIQTIALGIFITVLGLLTAIFVIGIVDRYIPDKKINQIIYSGLLLTLLLVIRSLAVFFRQKFLISLNKNVNVDINNDFLNHIFKIPKSFFDSRRIGDITARINDSMMIQQAVLVFTNTTIIDGLVILGSLILMFVMAPELAWISVMLIPVYSMILFTKIKKIKSEQSDVMKSHAMVESEYINSLLGIDEIIGFGSGTQFSNKNINIFKMFQVKIETLSFTKAVMSLKSELFSTVITILLLTHGAISVASGKLKLGQMMAAYSLLGNVIPAIGRFISASITVQGANIAVRRIRDILLVEKEKNLGEKLFVFNEQLCIKNVFFGWSDQDVLFDGISLIIPKGQIVAFWGASGSGKSSLIQLIQRKYNLKRGEILIDGVSAGEIDLFAYRNSIAVVPQDIRIFNGTFLENILIGRSVDNLDTILKCIDNLGLTEFVSKFEGGLFTLLGEEGQKLSGGEKQVLAVLRALLMSPEILIFDEGFSGLDVEMEKQLFTTLKQYAVNHAVFIITHNLRIILKADYSYFLENKIIAESGCPEELYNHKGSYLNMLVNLQNEETRVLS